MKHVVAGDMYGKSKKINSLLLVICLLGTGCTTASSNSSSSTSSSVKQEEITIDIPESEEVKTLADFETADMDTFLTGFEDFDYPEDDTEYYKGLYLSYPYLYGEMLDHDSHDGNGLFSLDTESGTYRKLIEYEEAANNMNVSYANDDYLLYWIETSGLQFIYYDLHTDEQTVIFHDPASNDIYVSADEGGFMYSCYNSEVSDYEIRYVSFPSMSSQVIATHSIMPVKAGNKWYFMTADDDAYKERNLSCYDGQSVTRMNINASNKRISSISTMDETHLLAVFLKPDSAYHSYVYQIDLTDNTAKYMFESSRMMERTYCAGDFITWGAVTGDYGNIGYLFNWKEQVNYPMETHFIWLDDDAIAYRKAKMPFDEISKYYMLDRNVTCISVKQLSAN